MNDFVDKFLPEEVKRQRIVPKVESQLLYPEDFEPGKAGAILNVGPEDTKCTGSFHYKRMSTTEIIDVVAHYITNVVLAHFENRANKV